MNFNNFVLLHRLAALFVKRTIVDRSPKREWWCGAKSCHLPSCTLLTSAIFILSHLECPRFSLSPVVRPHRILSHFDLGPSGVHCGAVRTYYISFLPTLSPPQVAEVRWGSFWNNDPPPLPPEARILDDGAKDSGQDGAHERWDEHRGHEHDWTVLDQPEERDASGQNEQHHVVKGELAPGPGGREANALSIWQESAKRL